MNEIEKLIEYLKDCRKWEYTIENRDFPDYIYHKEKYKGWQIRIPELDFSAIWLHGSYGYEKGLIEVMCKCKYSYDSVIGNLTCNQVINILNNYELLAELSKKRYKEVDEATSKIKNAFDAQIADIINKED